jgi:hypothetical protein
MDHWFWGSRTLKSPSMHRTIVEPSETFVLPLKESILACFIGGHSVAQQHLSLWGLHCPGHAVFHVLKGVGPFPIQPWPVTMWLPRIQPPHKSAKGP